MTIQTSAGEITLNKFSCRKRADEFQSTVARTHNSRIIRNKKRRALRGKQTVELLMNSVGKRIPIIIGMLLIPTFLYFFNLFFVMCHAFATSEIQSDCKKLRLIIIQ